MDNNPLSLIRSHLFTNVRDFETENITALNIKGYFNFAKLSTITFLINILIIGAAGATSVTQNTKQYQLKLGRLQIAQNSERQATPDSEVLFIDRDALRESILAEINRVRTNPQDYADWLEERKQYFEGTILKLPGEKPVRTNKGKEALEEAIAWLRNLEPLPNLSYSAELVDIAQKQINSIATNQEITNSKEGIISYGKYTSEGIVMQLIVDDGYPDRPHRRSILDPSMQLTGIVCEAHDRYENICAIAYQGSSEVTAENTESKESTLTSNTEVDRNQPDLEISTIESESTEKSPANDSENRSIPPLPIPHNPNNSLLLEKIQRGSLEQGDRVIPDDGSLYDSYPLEGRAGDSFIISVESDDFDTFLAIMDAKGNILQQNDDIKEGNSNSRLTVTLPSNGVYNVIVNAYDRGGKGKYLLTVRR